MKISEFKEILGRNPDSAMRFVLPGGTPIPADYHVTEVGHATKNFIDCGGTKRFSESCVLQVWLARNDKDHRLSAGKLGSIMELARSVLPPTDLDVEIEFEDRVVSRYPVDSFEAVRGELTFSLGVHHTDCLAREACGLQSCSEDACCS